LRIKVYDGWVVKKCGQRAFITWERGLAGERQDGRGTAGNGLESSRGISFTCIAFTGIAAGKPAAPAPGKSVTRYVGMVVTSRVGNQDIASFKNRSPGQGGHCCFANMQLHYAYFSKIPLLF
jgi:hypothetical protein